MKPPFEIDDTVDLWLAGDAYADTYMGTAVVIELSEHEVVVQRIVEPHERGIIHPTVITCCYRDEGWRDFRGGIWEIRAI